MVKSLIEISAGPLREGRYERFLKSAGNGAIVVFRGVVRGTSSDGRVVRHIDYESYDEMCRSLIEEMVEELTSSVEGARVALFHRKGKVEPGEIALYIGVSTPHREEAFSICREILERIKKDLPVWKEEIFEPPERG